MSANADDDDKDSKKIYDYPGHAKSDVWIYFGFYSQKDSKKLDLSKAVCKICFKTYVNNGNTTNFRAHLTREHASQIQPKESKDDQPKLTAMFGPKRSSTLPLPAAKQEQITQVIADFIVHSLQPLSTAEDPYFRQVLLTMEPRYKPPCSKTMLDKMKKKYDIEKQDIIKKIRDQDLAITHDGWTCLNTESYETVTGSYITDEWQLVCKVLQTVKVEGSHTAENIAGALTAIKQKWKFGATVATTDNASNEVKAFQLLSWPRLSCMGHNINLVVNTGLKMITRIIAKGRSLVSYFHRSPLAMGILFEKQKVLLAKDKQGHKLITDCATRWNSTLDMLERVTEQTAALHAVALDPACKNAELQSKLYTFAEQDTVEKIIAVLKPFKVATVILSSETKPTLSLVLPCLVKLEMALVIQQGDSTDITKMKKAMLSNLEKRKTIQAMGYYTLASYLDPRTKGLGFISPEDRQASREKLIQACLKKLSASNTSVQVKQEPKDSEDHDSANGSVDGVPGTNQTITPPTAAQALPALPQMSDEDDPLPMVTQDHSDNSDDEPPEPPEKVIKVDTHQNVQSDWLDDVVCIKTEAAKFTPYEMCAKEVDRYTTDEKQLNQQDDPMKWWKTREIVYPILSSVARQLLAIPASSVPSERIFSLAGQIVTKRRTQLSPQNVDLLIFLNKNSKMKEQ